MWNSQKKLREDIVKINERLEQHPASKSTQKKLAAARARAGRLLKQNPRSMLATGAETQVESEIPDYENSGINANAFDCATNDAVVGLINKIFDEFESCVDDEDQDASDDEDEPSGAAASVCLGQKRVNDQQLSDILFGPSLHARSSHSTLTRSASVTSRLTLTI